MTITEIPARSSRGPRTTRTASAQAICPTSGQRAHDRRAFLIHLTPSGRRAQREAATALADAADTLLTPLDAAERQYLVDLLATVAAHWQQLSASQDNPGTSRAGDGLPQPTAGHRRLCAGWPHHRR
jgi:hypothetical protein